MRKDIVQMKSTPHGVSISAVQTKELRLSVKCKFECFSNKTQLANLLEHAYKYQIHPR